MAKWSVSKGWVDEKTLPKVGRRWGRLLFYKSRYGNVVRTIADTLSPKQERVLSRWSEWLRWMNVIWKYVSPEVKLEFLRQERVSGIPARDIFISSANGLLWYFETDDGRRIYSMAHKERISKSLDVFSQVRGSLLVRKDDVWDAILPGQDGFVLTISGGEPKWMPGGGLGRGVFHFVCKQLDGQYGWSGVGLEGIQLIRLDKNAYHYVRVALPAVTGNIRFVISFSCGFQSGATGDVVMRGTVYVRKDHSFEQLASSDAVFSVTGGDMPAYNWSLEVVANIGLGVVYPLVELARVGNDSRDTCDADLYLFFLDVSIY